MRCFAIVYETSYICILQGLLYPLAVDVRKCHDKNEYDKDITAYGRILEAMIEATRDSSELATVISYFI